MQSLAETVYSPDYCKGVDRVNQATIDSELTLHGAPTLLQQAIHAHTFDNPRYLQALKHGRATNRIPEQMEVFRQSDDALIVPRGYLEEIRDQVQVMDWRTEALRPLPPLRSVTLRDYQSIAATAAAAREQGLVVAPTGSGKTFIGLELIRQRGQRALILVHTSALADQWRKVIKEVMGIEAGTVGGGKWNEGEEITVAMLQTLYKQPEKAADCAKGYGLVLVDECHHVPANSFTQVMAAMHPRYRYGLTATPEREDGLEELLYRVVGPVLATVEHREIEQTGGTVPAVVKVIQTGFDPGPLSEWREYLQALVDDPERNRLIAATADKAAATVPVLVLTERIEHAERLHQLIEGESVLIHGKLPTKDKRAALEQAGQAQCTVGTFSMLGEGLDYARWGALILATPVSGRTRLLQAVGRVLRPHPHKRKAYIADLIDHCAFSYSSHQKRLEIYQERGVSVV